MPNKHFINSLNTLLHDNNSYDLDLTFNIQQHIIHISSITDEMYEIDLLDQNYELIASVNNITHNLIPQTVNYLLQ